MTIPSPKTLSDFSQEVIKKILSQSLLVILLGGLFYYVLIRGQSVQEALIVEKDKRIQHFYEMMMLEREERASMFEGLYLKTKESYELRLRDQKENYEKILDFYQVRLEQSGFIEKQYQNK